MEEKQQMGEIVKLSNIDLDDDDVLVDEDDLLSSYNTLITGLSIPNKTKKICTSRISCKNCTCGRSDGSKFISKCGNCHLGDGFRCSSCPSKGLPPFSPGEKVEINI